MRKLILTFTATLALSCTDKPKDTLGIQSSDGYGRATEAAMNIWNGFVGCKFLVPGDDVLIKSDDGEPCGDPWRPEGEWGHAGTSYLCADGKFQILVSQPGDLHDQVCIIGHELGHVLGREHASIGIMGKTDPCPEFIRIRDADVAALRSRFCK